MPAVAERREVAHGGDQGGGNQEADAGNRQQLLDVGQRCGLALEWGFQAIDPSFEVANLFQERDQGRTQGERHGTVGLREEFPGPLHGDLGALRQDDAELAQ